MAPSPARGRITVDSRFTLPGVITLLSPSWVLTSLPNTCCQHNQGFHCYTTQDTIRDTNHLLENIKFDRTRKLVTPAPLPHPHPARSPLPPLANRSKTTILYENA